LNSDVLNLSVKIIKGHVRIDSAPNAKYTDKTITYYLITSCISQTRLTRLVIIVLMLLQKKPLDTGFIILIWRKLNSILIRKLKNKTLKPSKIYDFRAIKIRDFESIIPKVQSFAIDFVNILFYEEEENKGDVIQTKP